MRTMTTLRTISETAVFQSHAAEIWTDDELMQFKVWLAANPEAGDVVPGTGGVRKVRWSRPGMGKRGGARAVYFNEIEGRIWLLMAYTKAKFDNLPAKFLAQLKLEVGNGQKD